MSETATHTNTNSGAERSSDQQVENSTEAVEISQTSVESGAVEVVNPKEANEVVHIPEAVAISLPEEGLFAVASGYGARHVRSLESQIKKGESIHKTAKESGQKDEAVNLETLLGQINKSIAHEREKEGLEEQAVNTQIIVGRRFQEGGQSKLACVGSGDVRLGVQRGEKYEWRSGLADPEDSDEPQGLAGQDDIRLQKNVVNLKPGDRVVLYSGNIGQKVEDSEFRQILRSGNAPKDTARELVGVSGEEAGQGVVVFDEPTDSAENLGGQPQAEADQNDNAGIQRNRTVERIPGRRFSEEAERREAQIRRGRDPEKSRQRAEAWRAAKESELETKHQEWANQYFIDNIDLFADREELEARIAESGLNSEAAILSKLISAREQLAEASANVRRSSLWFSAARREQTMKQASEDYHQARREYFEKQLDRAAENGATTAQLKALVAELGAQEDGALMGEETHYYLDKENSVFNRLAERYQSMSRAKRLVLGLGGGAVLGAASLVTGGAALAGGAGALTGASVAARVGRGYLNREAGKNTGWVTEEDVRLNEQGLFDYHDRNEQLSRKELRKIKVEQNATLRNYNFADYDAKYQKLRGFQNRDSQGNFATIENQDLTEIGSRQFAQNETEAAINYNQALAEAEAETKDKRKSMAWAVGGAAVGYLLAEAASEVDWGERWDDLREEWDERFGSGGGEVTEEDVSELQEQLDQAQEEAAGGETTEAPTEEAPAGEETPAPEAGEEAGGPLEEVSEQARYLYGDLAGEDITITISEEGELIWDELEEKVGDRPDKQRIVGNIVKKMEDKYGSFDLNPYHPGDSFTVTLE